MTTPQPPIAHTGLRSIDGPLLVVGDVQGVGYDETVAINLPGGETRHGVVLEVDGDLA